MLCCSRDKAGKARAKMDRESITYLLGQGFMQMVIGYLITVAIGITALLIVVAVCMVRASRTGNSGG